MRNTLLILVAAASSVVAVNVDAAIFTQGNLAIFRYGDGSESLGSGNTVSAYVDEYTTAGALVQTIALPKTGPTALTVHPAGGREGIIQLAQDGHSIVLGGYRADQGAANPTGAPKVIGVVKPDGTVDTTTSYTSAQVGNPIRSVATKDGTSFYTSADGGNAAAYVPYGPSAAAVAIQAGSWRTVHVANNQLYGGSGSSGWRGISTIGSGLPTTAGQSFSAITPAPNPATGPGVSSMVFASDNANIIYAAGSALNSAGDDFRRYVFNGTSWTLTGTGIGSPAGASSAYGVFAIPDGLGGETLYATTKSALYKVVDANPLTTNFSSLSLVKLADAPSGTEFRGLAGVPVAIPEPTTTGLVALGAAGLLARRRK